MHDSLRMKAGCAARRMSKETPAVRPRSLSPQRCKQVYTSRRLMLGTMYVWDSDVSRTDRKPDGRKDLRHHLQI